MQILWINPIGAASFDRDTIDILSSASGRARSSAQPR